ncbi:MAG: Mlr3941 protein [uncultured Thermomicrobiales bacterium]|uniref:Mlr3941 protein n=1 Tax=uncultured Thermomicrobiales bacterium TaxID=1645740 RepID=A0A6J4VE90_9BACT|nr:MAG: Mlr3941 protein [uncultured Thermomicrobiales bacterium]
MMATTRATLGRTADGPSRAEEPRGAAPDAALVGTTLVLGGTGKTGRRVTDRLAGRGLPFRVGSRSGEPPFDWEDPATWAPVLRGAASVYVTYYPDLAVPGAVEAVRSFAGLAVGSGVRRLVLLSGRGEDEAERTEAVVQESGAEWTILRSNWFCQNFSESYLLPSVLSGEVVLPAGDVGEPFVDADDIADVAVAALTEDGHAGMVYELSGPRPLTFADAVAEIAAATGREIRYARVSPEQYATALAEEGVPADYVWLLNYLFTTVLDGRNSRPADGVRRALGRGPRDFADYARDAATAGAWDVSAAPVPR